MERNHQIGRLILEMELPEDANSVSWQEKASIAVSTEITRLFNEKLNALAVTDQIIRLDKLEIELGDVVFEEFNAEFLNILEKRLDTELQQIINSKDQFSGSHQEITTDENNEELLFFFLKAGYLPWWAQSKSTVSIDSLVANLCLTAPATFITSLRNELTNLSMLNRLIRNISESTLLKIAEISLNGSREILELNSVLNKNGLLSNERFKKFILGFALKAAPLRLTDKNRINDLAEQLIMMTKHSVGHLDSASNQNIASLVSSFLLQVRGKNFLSYPVNAKRFTLSRNSVNKSQGNAAKHLGDSDEDQLKVILKVLLEHRIDFAKEFLSNNPLLSTYFFLLMEEVCGTDSELATKLIVAIKYDSKAQTAMSFSVLFSNQLNALQKIQILDEGKSVSFLADEKRVLSEFKKNLEATAQIDFPSNTTTEADADLLKANDAAEDSFASSGDETDMQEVIGEIEEQFKYSDEEIYISHAGLVILHPFLIPFYKELGYLNGNHFKDEESKHKAVYILHFLATGSEEIPEEHELVLPKLICGVDLDEVLLPFSELTEKEREECQNLLTSVITHWKALKSTSPAGLRHTFISRAGKLSHNSNGWTVRVERLALDLLLDQIPWGFAVLKTAWNREVIFVEW